jgi:acyl-CoA synthetase (AMP-forming)/AMP-acid ligase II
VTATDLFNLQYTSGTTGPPKACMLTHEYWMRTAALEAELIGHPLSIRRTLLWQPLFYMAAPWRAFMTFLLGGTVYVPRRMSARRFYGWLRDHRIEYCTFPEWALEHCPESPPDGELGLRHVHAYGWNPNSHAAFERNYRVVARDSFGMSEVGIATDTPIEAAHMTGSGTCGLALPMRELRICDAQGVDVPIGREGELCIAGRGILDGYYQRPDANVDSFRDRWFRTGDLARRDEAGYFYIVGRIKEVIRRSGESVSAREVENVLKELPGVSEVAVVGVPDPQRVQEVKAYLKLGAGVDRASVDPGAVLAHCARSLARFKWPRYIAYVDEFPRTPTHKIAKAELVRQAGDLRAGAFDATEGLWR